MKGLFGLGSVAQAGGKTAREPHPGKALSRLKPITSWEPQTLGPADIVEARADGEFRNGPRTIISIVPYTLSYPFKNGFLRSTDRRGEALTRGGRAPAGRRLNRGGPSARPPEHTGKLQPGIRICQRLLKSEVLQNGQHDASESHSQSSKAHRGKPRGLGSVAECHQRSGPALGKGTQ